MTNVSVPRETGETKGVKSRVKACFGYALQEGRRRSQMITKDEIQEMLRMFSSEDDVTSLSQALSLSSSLASIKQQNQQR